MPTDKQLKDARASFARYMKARASGYGQHRTDFRDEGRTPKGYTYKRKDAHYFIAELPELRIPLGDWANYNAKQLHIILDKAIALEIEKCLSKRLRSQFFSSPR